MPADGSSDSQNEVVGLSNARVSRRSREMLDLVNRLHSTGVQAEMDLPVIAVIGSQSAGKSSLIEAISGIKLPRASGTCTRCATECKLSRSDRPWTCVVKLQIMTDANGQVCKTRNVPFGAPIQDKDEVEERIRRAQRAILNPSTEAKIFLDGGDVDEDENAVSFSKNIICLEISGPDVADLSFVDLPGLIVSTTDGNRGDIDLVRSLVDSWIKKPSCVILLTVTCETDFNNQGAYEIVREHDPKGDRTVGVLTKPDLCQEGDETFWVDLVKGLNIPLSNNWFCVKQPTPSELKKGITWQQARKNEDTFFMTKEPWASLPEERQRYLRTSNLTERLSVILSDLIATRLPKIQDELKALLQKTEEEKRKLPKAPSSDPVGEVLQALNVFTIDITKRMQGTPDEDGVLQTIRPRQVKFQRAVRATAPNFQPFESGREDSQLEDPSFLSNEEIFSTESQEDENPPIYIDQVQDRAQKAVTRELPGNYPFVVKEMYIKQFLTKWHAPALELFDETYDILKQEVLRVVDAHFNRMGRGLAANRVTLIVQEHLESCAERTREKIEWLLDVESMPTTLNTHYFADYRDKFLAHYRGARPKASGLSANLQSYTAPGPTEYPSGFQESVSRVLSGLSELGISAKPEDIPKMLPSDPMEPAIEIMASVRAYFQVAYKRFADMVPMTIDHEIVLGLNKGLEKALRDGLEITGPNAREACEALIEEASTISLRREELQKRLDTLKLASQELRTLKLT